MPLEEKLQHMINWWTEANRLLINEKITAEKIAEIVNNGHMVLRETVLETICWCEKLKV